MVAFQKSWTTWSLVLMAVLSSMQQDIGTAPVWLQATVGALLAGVVFARQWIASPAAAGVTKFKDALLNPAMLAGGGMAALSALQQLAGSLPPTVNHGIATLLVIIPIMTRGNAAIKIVPPATMLLLILLTSGCGAAWPQQCVAGLQSVECKCGALLIEIQPWGALPRPAGSVVTTCDGHPLPLVIHGINVQKP